MSMLRRGFLSSCVLVCLCPWKALTKSAVRSSVRSRLTLHQRRLICSAIRRGLDGVLSYGDPVIVDGLVKSIAPLVVAAEDGVIKPEQLQAVLEGLRVPEELAGE